LDKEEKMKTKIMFWAIILLLSAFTGNVFGGTEGSSNTLFGIGAGNSLGDDDDGATFIGYQAGYNTNDGTQPSHGKDNTFVGNSAGYSNTTGYDNTFLGLAAGYNNITGYYNAFLGPYAGYYNTSGAYNTFVGTYAGSSNTTGYYNTFLGYDAGSSNTTGYYNTFLGPDAGSSNTTGSYNAFLGHYAGHSNTAGSGNIFLGNYAGYYETGSNKLYIDNSNTSTPLIYGEFDNRVLTINGNLGVIGPYQGLVYLSNTTADNTPKVSRMVLNHYSNAEDPVYLFGAASTATNNFVAFGGGNTIGNAATQIDLYTAPNTTTLVGTPRITIKGNGYVGIGIQSPSYPLQMAGGAYSNGSSWIDVSSREYKENIEVLSTEEALEAIKELNPVRYAYKTDQTQKRVGFIAEEVPELVSMKDRKGLSPMDIVAVLTKVVQEQQRIMQEQQEAISTMREELKELKGKQ
jgi:hypothetical protein